VAFTEQKRNEVLPDEAVSANNECFHLYYDAEIVNPDMVADNSSNAIERRFAADPNVVTHGMKAGSL
jgi:hypothetical protein